MDFLEIIGMILFLMATLNIIVGIVAMKKAKPYYEDSFILKQVKKN